MVDKYFLGLVCLIEVPSGLAVSFGHEQKHYSFFKNFVYGVEKIGLNSFTYSYLIRYWCIDCDRVVKENIKSFLTPFQEKTSK